MTDKKEMTALNTSVGADDGQSLKSHVNSISENSKDFNDYEENILKMQQEFYRQMDPSYLKTVSMTELYDTVYPGKAPLIDGLLYPGTYLFVGAPKLGKSFLMAQLAYHISTGTELWNYPVRKGTVLYLALEDDYKRLQTRLYKMFGTEGTENLFFSVSAGQLGNGLDEQLQGFMQEHLDTTLIIIDTLQKVREVGGDSYSYSNDYEIINRLKKFADNCGICLLLVHHTRKQQSDDRFDMISGTNGLLGAADGAFLLSKEKRTNNSATLDVSGRDQQDQKLYLVRDPEKLIWSLERTETELWKEPPEPLLEAIAKHITNDNPKWN
jgi:RecA-family ATPase